eukprot:gene8438-264_t
MSEEKQTEQLKVEEIKVSVCGGGGVGKSCLTYQYCFNKYKDQFDPTIEDTYQKKIKIGDTIVNLSIVDTAGQEEFKDLRSYYMRDSDGFLLVYDVCHVSTLLELDSTFMTQIQRSKDTEPFDIVFCGNKSDIPEKLRGENQVTKNDAQEIAEKHHADLLDTSAKEGKNIEEAFEKLVKLILSRRHPEELKVQKKKKKKNSGFFSSISDPDEDPDDIFK